MLRVMLHVKPQAFCDPVRLGSVDVSQFEELARGFGDDAHEGFDGESLCRVGFFGFRVTVIPALRAAILPFGGFAVPLRLMAAEPRSPLGEPIVYFAVFRRDPFGHF